MNFCSLELRNFNAIYTEGNAAAHSKAFVGSTLSVCQMRKDPAMKYFVTTSLSSVLCNRRKSEVKLDFEVKDLLVDFCLLAAFFFSFFFPKAFIIQVNQ